MFELYIQIFNDFKTIGKNTIAGIRALINHVSIMRPPLTLKQDRFGFSKIMLMVTKRSIYAVHTNGDIIWKRTIEDFINDNEYSISLKYLTINRAVEDIDLFKLFMLKTPHQHDEHPVTSEFAVIISKCGKTYTAKGNGLTGEIIVRDVIHFKTRDAFSVPIAGEEKAPVVLVGDGAVQVWPSDAEKSLAHFNKEVSRLLTSH